MIKENVFGSKYVNIPATTLIIIQFNSLFINVPNSTANDQLQSQHKHNNKIKQHRTKQQQ
jgi:hypothetical protein